MVFFFADLQKLTADKAVSMYGWYIQCGLTHFTIKRKYYTIFSASIHSWFAY